MFACLIGNAVEASPKQEEIRGEGHREGASSCPLLPNARNPSHKCQAEITVSRYGLAYPDTFGNYFFSDAVAGYDGYFVMAHYCLRLGWLIVNPWSMKHL